MLKYSYATRAVATSEDFFNEMKETGLYFYISKHLDENGRYTLPVLPDEPQPLLPQPLGTEDAAFYGSRLPSDEKGAQRLQRALLLCLKNNDAPHRRYLYDLCRQMPICAVCDPLAKKLQEKSDLPREALLALAQEFFYTAVHRNPLKLAFILCGLYGMEKLKEHNPVLWRDLLNAARCEEFTFFFFYACRLSGFMPQHDVWVLAECTRGWGKVCALNEARCFDALQRRLLLRQWLCLEVEYPPLAVRLVEESELAKLLAEKKLQRELTDCAAALLTSLLLLLAEYPGAFLEELLEKADIPLETMLDDLLRHLEQTARSPLDYLPAAVLADRLRALGEAEERYLLSERQVQELIGRCDALVFTQNWEEAIDKYLCVDGTLNYTLLDFAFELGWDPGLCLLDYFEKKPDEYRLLPYLLSGEEEVAASALSIAEENLAFYMGSQEAFGDILFYLKDRPGQGEALVCGALTGMYDWPRSLAVDVLYRWGADCLTAALLQALKRAGELSYSPLLQHQIMGLLSMFEPAYNKSGQQEERGLL